VDVFGDTVYNGHKAVVAVVFSPFFSPAFVSSCLENSEEAFVHYHTVRKLFSALMLLADRTSGGSDTSPEPFPPAVFFWKKSRGRIPTGKLGNPGYT